MRFFIIQSTVIKASVVQKETESSKYLNELIWEWKGSPLQFQHWPFICNNSQWIQLCNRSKSLIPIRFQRVPGFKGGKHFNNLNNSTWFIMLKKMYNLAYILSKCSILHFDWTASKYKVCCSAVFSAALCLHFYNVFVEYNVTIISRKDGQTNKKIRCQVH